MHDIQSLAELSAEGNQVLYCMISVVLQSVFYGEYPGRTLLVYAFVDLSVTGSQIVITPFAVRILL